MTLALAVCLASPFVGAVSAGAQEPQRRVLTGTVVDTAGRPIAEAEVSIPELRRRTLTGMDGTFRFDTVPVGTREVRARKIGFAIQWIRTPFDSANSRVAFRLVPITQALPAMVTSANRRGLSGHVDERGKGSLPGAIVRVLGTGREAVTDGNGDFQLTLQHGGSFMVSISKDSFDVRLVSVHIPDDSGRNIVSQLDRSTKVVKGQSWIVPDIAERQAWILPRDGQLYTHEELERLKIEWIYDAVDMVGPRLGARQHFDRECAVVLDGGPKTAHLSTLTIDDVESVEVYRTFAAVPPSVTAAAPRSKTSKWKKSPPAAFMGLWADAAKENYYAERYCPAVYVWLR